MKDSKEEAEASGCEIELSDAIPPGAAIGNKVGALIEVAELTDVLFLGRPADSSTNGTAKVFVLEPGTSFARLQRGMARFPGP